MSYLTWLVPTVVTAALGVFRINVPMLWRDELATWSSSSRTPSQLWDMIHNIDAVLGVYYFGIHLWMAVFGDSPAALRVPSVIAMTASAAIVALIGRRLGGGRVALAAGLIFAVIPSVSRYAQEARPYAFATFFAALATLLLLRALERPSWLRWLLYALAIAATGVANLVGLCVLVAHAILVISEFARRTVRIGEPGPAGEGRVPSWAITETPPGRPLSTLVRFIVAAIVGVILVSPIAKLGNSQADSQIGQVPVPHFAQISGITGGLWQSLFASTAVAALVILLAVAGVAFASGVQARIIAAYAFLGGFAPVVGVWVASHGPSSYWTFRYMLFTVPAWAVAAGIGVVALSDRAVRLRVTRWIPGRQRFTVLAGGLVVIVALFAVHDQWEIRQYQSHNFWAFPIAMVNGPAVDYPAATAAVLAHAQPGDEVVYQNTDDNHYQVDTAFRYYANGASLPPTALEAYSQAESDSLIPSPCHEPADCLTGTPRLWVVYIDHLAPNPQDPFSALPSNQSGYLQTMGYTTKALYEETGITVALLSVGQVSGA